MITAAPDRPLVTPDTLVSELLKRHPQARAVLDRYGLRGCGGAEGPNESLRFFARMHGVDQAQLLAEIEQAAQRPAAPAASTQVDAPNVADTIYRRYFMAGVAVILTAGATWGAWLLWRIGFGESFTGVSVLEVNAHGHAQIFGWVGLFVMGFALQAFPRMWQSELPAPRLAVLSFLLMIGGLIVRTPAMAAGTAGPAMVGAAMQIVAIALFVGLVVTAWRCSRVRFEPYMALLFAGLGWFLVQAVYGTWHSHNLITAGTRDELIWYVATYQALLRDMQVHGLALCMILGVSVRMLPAMFELPTIPARRVWAGFAFITAGLLSEMGLFLAYRYTDNHAFAAGLLGAWVMLAAGVMAIAWPWRLWRPLTVSDRSGKFVRAAYGWLAISLTMLLLLPVYQVISGIPFSHAYYGAIRHAITVGFVSLMIMGFAAKVVATLTGRDTRTLSGLWGPFVLVNVGCCLRVSLQTATDWHALAFPLVGISGTLEVAGLAWWGGHLVRLMWQGRRAEDAGDAPPAPRPERIEPHHKVADVLAWYPQTEKVLQTFGFSLISLPRMRRSVARRVSLRQAAGMRGVDVGALLAVLNRAAGNESPSAALRYDAPLGELVRQHPRLAEPLAEWGVHPAGAASLTLEGLAHRLGWTKEDVAVRFAAALASEPCTGRCGSCGHHGGCGDDEGADR